MHPSQEHRLMNPVDIDLRRHGFKIHSRAKGQLAVWRLGDKLYDEHKAAEYIGIDPCTGKEIPVAEEVVEVTDEGVGRSQG